MFRGVTKVTDTISSTCKHVLRCHLINVFWAVVKHKYAPVGLKFKPFGYWVRYLNFQISQVQGVANPSNVNKNV